MVDQGKVGARGLAGASSRPLGHCLPSLPSPAGLMDACRECGARALELVGQLQDPQALPQARPGQVRAPLQDLLQLGQVRHATVALSGPGTVGG